MRLDTFALLAGGFVIGGIVGVFLAANAYEDELHRADLEMVRANGYRDLKACADAIERTPDLMTALAQDRDFIACAKDAVAVVDAAEGFDSGSREGGRAESATAERRHRRAYNRVVSAAAQPDPIEATRDVPGAEALNEGTAPQ